MLDGTERRILVVGSGGAGKSYVAGRLAAATGLPLIHLDQHYWKPGWEPLAPEAWQHMVATLCARGEWIMDGNYSATLRQRLLAADAVVFLDVPRWRCVARVLGRIVRHWGRTRPELPPGCPERFDAAFLLWVWGYPQRSRPKLLTELSAAPSSVKKIVLRSNREVRGLISRAGELWERPPV